MRAAKFVGREALGKKAVFLIDGSTVHASIKNDYASFAHNTYTFKASAAARNFVRIKSRMVKGDVLVKTLQADL